MNLFNKKPESLAQIKARIDLINAQIELESAKNKLKEVKGNNGIFSSLNKLLSSDSKKSK
jgi:hypothetical protein